MKKIFGICICLILLVGAIVAPTVAFATESTSSMTIHFLNPTAITVVDDSLFVVDNVDKDANKSVILTFSIGDSNATYRSTIEIDGNVTNLSPKSDDGLYAILNNKVIEYAIGDNASLDKVKEFGEVGELSGFVDAAYGQSGETKQTEYFLAQQGLYRNAASGWTEKFSGAVSSVSIGNYIYYLYNDGNKAVSKRFNGRDIVFSEGDVYNNGNGIATKYSTNPIGLFTWGDNLGVFWKDKIHYVEVTSVCSLPELLDYKAVTTSEETINIKDVSADNNKLFVLNDKNLIEVFAKGATDEMERLYTVGSDMVDQSVPHEFTSYTLARSIGYPSNLIFKTNDADTSIVELVTDAQDYIILGYDGDEDSLYYYVLTNDNRFGWVQKTNSKIVDGKLTDDKLEVINTNVAYDPSIEYTTKFASLNAVYIYNLPRSVDAFRGETFQQTASNMPEVIVKQRFTENTNDGKIVWYYVTYKADGQDKSGFVQSQYLSEFTMKVDESNLQVIEDRKINSTLFEAVKLYLYPDKDLMTDDNVVTNENGIVKLYSGKRVTVISESDGIAFIQIQSNNGSGNTYGYVDSSRLIGMHAITTNAIVGLSLLGTAILIASVFLAVYFKRKKIGSTRAKKDTSKN